KIDFHFTALAFFLSLNCFAISTTFAQVTSVFTRTGDVKAQYGDYAFSLISATPTTLAGYGITDGALDSTVVHLAGSETITGMKTFSSAPSVPDNSFAESKVVNLLTDLSARALDATVVHNAGNESISGTKTFNTAPV